MFGLKEIDLFLLRQLFFSSGFEHPLHPRPPICSLVFHVIALTFSSHTLHVPSWQCTQVPLQHLLSSLVLQCVILSFQACYTEFKKKTKPYKVMPPSGFASELLEVFVTSVQILWLCLFRSVQSAQLCLIKEMLSLKSSPIAVCFWFVDTPDFCTSLFAR